MGDPGIALVAGLGNPGMRHSATRHNAGAWFADAVAGRYGATFRPESRFRGEMGRVQIGVRECRVLKPTTYMNESGASISAAVNFYKVPLSALLVAHDEIDLPPGTVRLKHGGGHAGHNGLRDIIARCGSGEFLRLRIGVGHPGHKDEVVNYVLRPPSTQDRAAIVAAIERAVDVMEWIVAGDMERAMQALHTKTEP